MKLILHMITPICLILASCCKEPSVVPDPDQPSDSTKTLQVLWQTPLLSDTSECSADAHCVVGGNIIYSINFLSPTAVVRASDGYSGEPQWNFQEFFDNENSFDYGQILKVEQNLLLINNWDVSYVASSSTGQSFWKSKTPVGISSELRASVIGQSVYTTRFVGTLPYPLYSSVTRRGIEGSVWDTLVTLSSLGDTLFPQIEPPTYWTKPNSDTVLIIRTTYLSKGLLPLNGRLNRAHLYAFNLRTREYEWKLEDFVPSGNINIQQPIVDGDRLYLVGQPYLYCIDLNSGNVLWTTDQFNDGISSNAIVHNDLVIVGDAQSGCFAFDKWTGQKAWVQPNSVGTVYELKYFDGVVYFTSSGGPKIYALNANDGSIIWSEKSPNSVQYPDGGFFYSSIAIDEEHRLLYATDRYFLLCIKLPE